ncbi:hypothetical protein WOLCODRAFT_149811 [Wolfiporia cocos MD-104 SS10]|uniref:Uncharacterized protein n=1 Tax=Wolfiporia cocos (strain MD-104) TaxID=742152 RepID=A0A2H3JUF5_WOLCO|nr:hypothetical protein WOLCODRAFT_149811 [Wolfiporia cocos MD-104 SS10]
MDSPRPPCLSTGPPPPAWCHQDPANPAVLVVTAPMFAPRPPSAAAAATSAAATASDIMRQSPPAPSAFLHRMCWQSLHAAAIIAPTTHVCSLPACRDPQPATAAAAAVCLHVPPLLLDQ